MQSSRLAHDIPFLYDGELFHILVKIHNKRLRLSKGRIWDLIISVPDHCLSFYFFLVARVQVTKLSQIDSVETEHLTFC